MVMQVMDKSTFEKKKDKIISGGANNLHFLVDFDRTLTKGIIDGKEVPSLMEFFRSGEYISKDYASKSHALANFYRPIEKDPKIPLEEKKEKMKEWWTKHFELLIASGLDKKHLKLMIGNIEKAGYLQFRDGVFEFLAETNKKNIPVVIISSSGLGVTIEMLLKKHKKFYKNIYVITNEYGWDKNGKAISVKKPIIHVFNKDETVIENFPKIHNEIKNRNNIILLGDSLGDMGMANGSKYETLLSFGFLEEKVKENMDNYSQKFDVLLLNNSSFEEINKLVKLIN